MKDYIWFIKFGLFKRGAFGEVRLAFEKHTCNKYAIKIISKRKFTVNGKHQIVCIFIYEI